MRAAMLNNLSISSRLTLAASGLALANVALLAVFGLPMWHPMALVTHLVVSTLAIFAIGLAIEEDKAFYWIMSYPTLAVGLATGAYFAPYLSGSIATFLLVVAGLSVAAAALSGRRTAERTHTVHAHA
jgi:hypothetical protein